MKRGSTLLLHLSCVKPLIKSSSEAPSPAANNRLRTTRRLSAIRDRLLLFIIAGGCIFICTHTVYLTYREESSFRVTLCLRYRESFSGVNPVGIRTNHRHV